jgi:DNA-binding MarR family transcriptional regulator
MDAARQDPVAEIESALARLRLAQRHGRGPRGGPPFAGGSPDGTFGGPPDGAFAGPPNGTPDPTRGAADGPGPHGMHLRPDLGGRGHGGRGGPHGRRLGEALGAARFRLLERLVSGSASISELAEAIGVDQPRASRLVADAAARGLVDRTPDPTDARRMVVALTDGGRTMLAAMKDSRRSAVTTALDGFTEEETATFAALLARFVAGWPGGR